MAEGSILQTQLAEPITRAGQESARIRKIIGLKQQKTSDWVKRLFSGYRATFFNQPFTLQYLDDEVLQGLGDQIATTIVDAFGDWYPYKNKEGKFNYQQMRENHYFPYFGFIIPEGLSLNELLTNPQLFKQYRNQITLATTASFLPDVNGFVELARDARRQTINGVPNEFHGGIPSLSRTADWLDDKGGLAKKYHTLFSQIRACAPHGNTPTSEYVQKLQIRDAGLRISYHAPMFIVGNVVETDFGVRRTRDAETQIELNRNKRFYTFAGNHTQNIAALWQHQLGEPPLEMNVVDVEDISEYDYHYVTVRDHGENVYGAIEVHEEAYARNNGHNLTSLNYAIKVLDDTSPSILVKVPVETEESTLTQKYLSGLGFTPCGIEPSIDTIYWENGKLQEYKAPITLYFAKLGKKARERQIEVVPTLFLDGLDGTSQIYDQETGVALRNIDRDIRLQIKHE